MCGGNICKAAFWTNQECVLASEHSATEDEEVRQCDAQRRRHEKLRRIQNEWVQYGMGERETQFEKIILDG